MMNHSPSWHIVNFPSSSDILFCGSLPESHFSTRGTSRWQKKAFSGDSWNTCWCYQWDFPFIQTIFSVHLFPSAYPYSRRRHFLSQHKLKSHSVFQRMKIKTFYLYVPKIGLSRMKQYCLGRETILFEEPNTSVWRVKQYCLSVKM